MTIKPTTNYLAIAEKKASTTTSSGIIIEGGAGDTKLGYVLAVGPEVDGISVGDTVLPRWTDGVLLKSDGKSCVLLKQSDIVAVIVE